MRHGPIVRSELPAYPPYGPHAHPGRPRLGPGPADDRQAARSHAGSDHGAVCSPCGRSSEERCGLRGLVLAGGARLIGAELMHQAHSNRSMDDDRATRISRAIRSSNTQIRRSGATLSTLPMNSANGPPVTSTKSPAFRSRGGRNRPLLSQRIITPAISAKITCAGSSRPEGPTPPLGRNTPSSAAAHAQHRLRVLARKTLGTVEIPVRPANLAAGQFRPSLAKQPRQGRVTNRRLAPLRQRHASNLQMLEQRRRTGEPDEGRKRKCHGRCLNARTSISSLTQYMYRLIGMRTI